MASFGCYPWSEHPTPHDQTSWDVQRLEKGLWLQLVDPASMSFRISWSVTSQGSQRYTLRNTTRLNTIAQLCHVVSFCIMLCLLNYKENTHGYRSLIIYNRSGKTLNIFYKTCGVQVRWQKQLIICSCSPSQNSMHLLPFLPAYLSYKLGQRSDTIGHSSAVPNRHVCNQINQLLRLSQISLVT